MTRIEYARYPAILESQMHYSFLVVLTENNTCFPSYIALQVDPTLGTKLKETVHGLSFLTLDHSTCLLNVADKKNQRLQAVNFLCEYPKRSPDFQVSAGPQKFVIVV